MSCINSLVRTQRLKQAKVEAERDAALYKSHMESEYQKTLKEVRYIFPIKIVKIVGPYGLQIFSVQLYLIFFQMNTSFSN